MVKSKKVLSVLVSLAMSASVFASAIPASAAGSVADVLSPDNAGLAVWVKADSGISGGVWKDLSGKGNDLAVKGTNTQPDIIEDALNGYPAVDLQNESGNTFFAAKYDEMYQGDSTVFVVAKFNSFGDHLGFYSTGDGETPHQPGSYENRIMSAGKLETYYRNENGDESAPDRACPGDNSIPLGSYMNYSYTIADDGTNVSARYRYTDSEGQFRNESFNRGMVADNAFMNHYGFVLGNRDNYQADWGTPDLEVAEVIVVLDTMSDEDIDLVRDYLDEKYFGSGFDPFATAEENPADSSMPLAADDPRLALWVDGSSYNGATWIDKSASGNNMEVFGDVSLRTTEDLNDMPVVHFPGTVGSSAAVKLSEIYDGSSMIYFVYKPYKVNDPEAPADYNLSYRGVFTTDYMPPDYDDIFGRCSGIDVRHGSDGVELAIQSSSSFAACNYTSPQSYNEVTQILAWNPGRVNLEDPNGSSYLGYTRGFMDFELETLVEESQTIMNFEVKDGEDSLPNANTGADESARGLNRQSTIQWDTSDGAAKANMHYGYTIGNRWDDNGKSLLMDVAEMIVIHGTLTEQEKTDMSEYLKNKYFSASVAKIGDEEYTSLESAFAAAESGETVTLMADVSNVGSILLADGREITVDLAGFDIGFAYRCNFNIQHGTLNLTGSGTVYEEEPYLGPIVMFGSAADAADYSVATIASGVTLKGWAPLFISHSDVEGYGSYGIRAEISGTLTTISDKDHQYGYSVYINGLNTVSEGNVPIINLNGATLNSEGDITIAPQGMYIAGYADVSVNNSTIDFEVPNGVGIEMRAGKLNVTNSVIKGGTETPSAISNGNGPATSNAAISVAQHTSKLPVEITLADAASTYSGGAAFYQVDPQDNPQEDIDKISINISAGTFNGAIQSENKTGFISGGTFTQAPSIDYCALGYAPSADGEGNYVVTESAARIAPYATDSAVGDNGLGIVRFITEVQYLDGEVSAFGTYMLPLKLFDELTDLDTTAAVVRYDSAEDIEKLQAGVTYAADLVDIPTEFFGEPIWARSFMIVDGETVTCEMTPTAVGEEPIQ